MEGQKRKPNLIIRIGRMVKIRHLILLIFLFLANTYAWFIFSTKVSMGITAHIASWTIHFTSGDGQQVTNMAFYVDRVFPGMDEAKQSLNVSNTGTEPAILSYDLEYVRIFDDEYDIEDGYTQEDLEEMLTDDFPFKFAFIKSTDIIEGLTGTATFDVTLNWPYESGDDETDTLWGELAYEYYATNPSQPAIEVRMIIHAIQGLESDP